MSRRFEMELRYHHDHHVTPDGLNSGTIYYWRVNAAVQGGGQRLVSAVLSFRTTTPPVPPP